MCQYPVDVLLIANADFVSGTHDANHGGISFTATDTPLLFETYHNVLVETEAHEERTEFTASILPM